MTTKTLFERGRVTDWLLDQYRTLLDPGVLLGDGEAPEEGGWPGNEPGQGNFVPYLTVATLPGAPTFAQALGDANAGDWTLRYQIRYFGGLRAQADWAADKGRAVWTALLPNRLDVGDLTQWRAYKFSVTSMGAVTRDDTVTPPYWYCVDEVALNLSRCRT